MPATATELEAKLRALRDERTLRDLFCHTLHYEYADEPLVTRDWPDHLRNSFKSARVIARHGDFKIVHFELPELHRAQERALALKALQSSLFALFVFSEAAGQTWRFVNVKFDEEIGKRRILRRYTIGPDERLRTASERLSLLDIEAVRKARPALHGLDIQTQHDSAFDVRPVTAEFFKTYKDIFESVEKQITGISDTDKKRLFTQKLFNRLMFIAFVQKKGWLRFDDSTDYLNALWRSYPNKRVEESNFYNSRLRTLFFSGLNNENNKDMAEKGRYFKKLDPHEPLIGNVPYLNGGLFEKDPSGEDDDPSIKVPDTCIDAILHRLFNQYNFTITESTPTDIEVAVDPEMLGRVFEELVTGRHESGSYYTPKEIVSFMSRESLKGYLEQELNLEEKAAIECFVDLHEAALLKDPESALEALQNIRVCDPACGSGAYLVGMLQELIALRNALFVKHQIDPTDDHQRKLEIIQNCVYGVDIDPFAVNIARLRLWLTLSVEADQPIPLPNLDFKIECEDSLTAPDPSLTNVGFIAEDIKDFFKMKGEFLERHDTTKKQLLAEIDGVRKRIKSWVRKDQQVTGFDWAVEFAEVFMPQEEPVRPGGFDIVLANPPYIRHELITALKPALKSVYGEFYCGTADLYTYFYARALQLLRPGGMLAFISSNKWFRAAYGANLRRLMAKETCVRSITDFGELPVFTAATFPMIFVTQKRGTGVPPVGTHARDAHATDEVKVKQGAYLPHWSRDGGIYHVVFRLHDSLPQSVYREWLAERDDIRKNAEAQKRALTEHEERRLAVLHSQKVDRYLDQGHGACYFRQEAHAELMANALRHFDGDRYRLHAWCVMPNHVHIVVEPIGKDELPKILHSWKSFTAHEINKRLSRTGDFWQTEYYDHLIRDEKDYAHIIEYVLNNPVAAGLKNWKCVSSTPVPGVDAEEHARDAHATVFTQVKSLDPPYPDVRALIAESGFALPPNALNGAEWRLVDAETAARMRRMEQSGVPLGEYVKGEIYYGLKTGCDEAFLVDAATRDRLIHEHPSSAEVLKPIIFGDVVRTWSIQYPALWMIFAPWDFDLQQHPAIANHLSKFRPQLQKRPEVQEGRYPWYVLGRYGSTYHHLLALPKIVYPEIAMSPRFALDITGAYTLKTVFSIPAPAPDLYLLGILNSAPAWDYLSFNASVLGDAEKRGRLTLQSIFVSKLPIPRASDADRAAIEALVQQILDLKAADPAADVSALEAEIDRRVASLYGL